MSRKSNPTSFRLGLSQRWTTTFSIYGKNFNPYVNLLYNKVKVKQYLLNSLKGNHLVAEISEYVIHSNYVNLTLHYLNDYELKKDLRLLFASKEAHATSLVWVKIPLIINFYNQEVWSNTSFFLINYIKSSFKKKNSFKRIFKKVESHLLKQLSKKIVSYNVFGPKYINIKGLKICCRGRLGSSRNPLTQIFRKSIGSLPLNKVNSYVDYNQDYLYTKQGVYGIQVWVFCSF